MSARVCVRRPTKLLVAREEKTSGTQRKLMKRLTHNLTQRKKILKILKMLFQVAVYKEERGLSRDLRQFSLARTIDSLDDNKLMMRSFFAISTIFQRWTEKTCKRPRVRYVFYPLGKSSEKPLREWHPLPPPLCTSEGWLCQRGAFAIWFHFEMKAFVMCCCFRKLIKRLELLEPSYQAMNHSTSYVR